MSQSDHESNDIEPYTEVDPNTINEVDGLDDDSKV